MPELDAITVLLINEQADESQRITMSLKSSYPRCRVETICSADEALEWTSKLDWHVIFLDEQLCHHSRPDLLREVRRRAPHSAIIVEAIHQDQQVAARTICNGADYYVLKHSAVFLTDLPIVMNEALQKRDLRTRLDVFQDRYRNLIDNLFETVYELDAEGRFVYISPSVKALLNYEPHELIGLRYSALVLPDELGKADRHFNERRSAPRATRRLQLRLRDKREPHTPITVEINATALYNRHHQFLGTTGVLSRVPGQWDEAPTFEPSADVIHPPTTLPGKQEAKGTINQPHTERSLHPLSFHDRRQFARVEIQVETCLRRDGRNWTGTALNVSLGGVYMIVKGPVSTVISQPMQLGFTSAVGVLEIPGAVCGIREPIISYEQHHKMSPTGLAIEFSGLKEPERQILTSLLDSLHSRTITVKLIGLLTSQDGDERNQGHAGDHTHVGQASMSPLTIKDDGRDSLRRRVSARTRLVVPVQVEATTGSLNLHCKDAYLIDLTVSGACLQLQASPDLIGHRLRLHLTAYATLTKHTSGAAPTKRNCVTGEVIWIAPATNRPEQVPYSLSEMPVSVGLRFIRFEGDSEQRIAELVTHDPASAGRIGERGERATLISEILDKHERRSLFDS